MERDRPPVVLVTVTTPAGAAGAAGEPDPEDLLASQRPPRPAVRRPVGVLALAATTVLAAGLLVAQDVRRAADAPPPPASAGRRPAPVAAADDGLTATATLGAARTDQRFVQRLTLTVVLEPYDGRGDSGPRLLGDEVALVDVRVRGFTVVPDDRRTPIPLGRFGRTNVGRATTVPLEAAVSDCSTDMQARREVDLDLRTGDGPVEVVRAAVQPELVRALDRVVSRACRRPRG